MRRLLITCLLSLAAFAQDPSAIGGSQGAQQVFNGFLYANAFGTWSVPQGDVGQFTWSNPHVCENPTGVTFNLFSVGLPIKIIDADVTKNETTTITAVVKTGFQCSIVTAPLTFSHFSFRIVSGTLGLQEALNYAIQRNLNTTVFLTNAWTMMGGTTGMITSAVGNANIGVADERSPLHKAYAWNGSAYIQQGLGGFGITNIDGVPIGLSVPSTGAFTDVIISSTPYRDVGAYPNVQQALNASSAPGTVLLKASYSETLTAPLTMANNNTRLLCQPGATLTKGFNGDAISVTANNVTIDGCSINANNGSFTGRAIKDVGGNNFTLVRSTITNPQTDGVYLSGVNGASIYNNTISGMLTGDAIFGEKNTTNVEVFNNTLDRSAATGFSHVIAFHSTTPGQIVSGLKIHNNYIINGHSFCVEIGSFTGNAASDNAISDNVCVEPLTASVVSGGYSFSGMSNSTVSGNVYRNMTGIAPPLAALEMTGGHHNIYANNNVIGLGAMSLNDESWSTVTGNTARKLFIDGSVAGENTSYNTVANNTISRFAGLIAGQVWSAALPVMLGYTILDSNGNLQQVVSIPTTVASVSTGGSPPTWATAGGAFTTDTNPQIIWQNIGSHATYAAFSVRGLWVQCNASPSDCSHNEIVNNKIQSDASDSAEGVRVEGDAGTLDSTTVVGNDIFGWTVCFNKLGVQTNTKIGGNIGCQDEIGLTPNVNLVPDSAFKLGNTFWVTSGTTFNSSGPQNDGAIALTGTGSPAGSNRYETQISGLTINTTYAFSGYVDATNASVNAPHIFICKDNACATIVGNILITAGTKGTINGTFTTDGSTTSVWFVFFTNNATIANGLPLIFSEPQVNLGTAIKTYQVSTSSSPSIASVTSSLCTNGELTLSAGWQSTGSATATAVQGIGTCSWTITTGTTTAANPTITDTLVNALPNATTVCWMNIYGGTHTAVAGEALRQTTLSATAPIFTANFTPTAGGTTYFVTRGCGP